MAPVLILPGIGGSGPDHWQTRWEALHPDYTRVEMPDWDRPELEQWLAVLQAAVDATSAPPVVVAHSLGCLALAHFVGRGGRIEAALLVAVPDPEGPAFPQVATSFAGFPCERFDFVSQVVASRNDPYGSFAFAERCAKAWGSTLHDVGPAGHINADSNLGAWPAGQQLLAALLA